MAEHELRRLVMLRQIATAYLTVMAARVACVLAAAMVVLLLSLPASAHTGMVSGRATVIDGDTLEIRGQRIRLQGVDAPESQQLCRNEHCRLYRCGQHAANALAACIGTRTVECEPVDTDRYGRTVALCHLGTLDLNGWLVEQGLAVAYRRYSTAYVPQEKVAQRAGRGLWAGPFTMPWQWRRARFATGEDGRAGMLPAMGKCVAR